MAPRLKTILILLHTVAGSQVPAIRVSASQHISKAQGMMSGCSWIRVTAAFAVVTELFIKDDKLLVCSQNKAAISTIVSAIAGNSI